MSESWGPMLYFAHRLEDEKGVEYHHLYRGRAVLSLCGDYPVVVVEAREASREEEGEYWGWLPKGEEEVLFIYSAPFLVSMCFPEGVRAAEERGDGRLVSLILREMPEPESYGEDLSSVR